MGVAAIVCAFKLSNPWITENRDKYHITNKKQNWSKRVCPSVNHGGYIPARMLQFTKLQLVS